MTPKETNIHWDVKKQKNYEGYDCVVGLSGGVDSSYTLLKTLECGLNPLVVHVDNGWNSSLSQRNIEVLVKKTEVKYKSIVLNWQEFRDHQKALFT